MVTGYSFPARLSTRARIWVRSRRRWRADRKPRSGSSLPRSRADTGEKDGEGMRATASPICRWQVGEVEITRVLEFESALFDPAVIYPASSPAIVERHRAWLEPT